MERTRISKAIDTDFYSISLISAEIPKLQIPRKRLWNAADAAKLCSLFSLFRSVSRSPDELMDIH